MVHPFEIVAVGTHPAGLVADVISHEFGISRSAVSHQLRTLREAGAVDVLPNDQERLYILEEEFLHTLDDAVGDLFELWDHRYGYGTGPRPAAARGAVAHPAAPPPRAQGAPRPPLTSRWPLPDVRWAELPRNRYVSSASSLRRNSHSDFEKTCA